MYRNISETNKKISEKKLRKIDRILKYLDSQNISLSEFERRVQLGYSYLGKTRDRDADITPKFLEKIRTNAPGDYFKIFPEELPNAQRLELHDEDSGYGIEKINWQSEAEKLEGKVTNLESILKERTERIDFLERLTFELVGIIKREGEPPRQYSG